MSITKWEGDERYLDLSVEELCSVRKLGEKWDPFSPASAGLSSSRTVPPGIIGQLFASSLLVNYGSVLSLVNTSFIPLHDISSRARVPEPVPRNELLRAAGILMNRFDLIRIDYFGIRLITAAIQYCYKELKIIPSKELVNWLSFYIDDVSQLDFRSDYETWLSMPRDIYPHQYKISPLPDLFENSYLAFLDSWESWDAEVKEAFSQTLKHLQYLDGLRTQDIQSFDPKNETPWLSLAKKIRNELSDHIREMEEKELELRRKHAILRPDRFDVATKKDLLRTTTYVVQSHFTSHLAKRRKMTGNIAYSAAHKLIFGDVPVRGDFGKLAEDIRELKGDTARFWQAIYPKQESSSDHCFSS